MTEAPTQAEAPAGPSPFDALEAQAVQLESGAAAAMPGAPEPIDPLDQATAECAEIVELVRTLVGPFAPREYVEAYGPKERQAIATTWGRLAVKYEWNMGEALSAWGAEIGAVASIIGPVLPLIVRKRQAAQIEAAKPAPVDPTRVQAAPSDEGGLSDGRVFAPED